jgi:hypothetical protein
MGVEGAVEGVAIAPEGFERAGRGVAQRGGEALDGDFVPHLFWLEGAFHESSGRAKAPERVSGA